MNLNNAKFRTITMMGALLAFSSGTAQARHEIIGPNRGQPILAPYEKQLLLTQQQIQQNDKMAATGDRIATALEELGEKMVEQQAKTNELLAKIATMEEERSAMLKEQEKLKDAVTQNQKAVKEDKDALSLNALESTAGANSGRVTSRNQDGSIIFRVKE